ncbi:MAG: CvpA family protein [Bacteroidetes bacterium]|nr:CvpA family protein [Bacteroidota bacterium]
MILFDLVLGLIIGIGFYYGFKRGLVISVFSMIGVFLGIVLAMRFVPAASGFILQYVNINSDVLPIVAFILVFALVFIGIRFLGTLITKFLKFILLNVFNKILGGILGALVVSFVLSTFIWLGNQVNALSPESKAHSKMYRYVEPLAPVTISFLEGIIPGMRGLMDRMEKSFEKVEASQNLLEI